MENIQMNSMVNVQAYKHNGKLYRQWNGAKIIDLNSEKIVLFLFKSKVAEANNQKWMVHEPIIWYLSRQEFFNTTAMIKKNGIYFYTNLASPILAEDKTIKFIDYDVDIKFYPFNKVKIVDKMEFQKHIVKFNYPEKLVYKIQKTTQKIVDSISSKQGFFNAETINNYVTELVHNKDLAKKNLKKIVI